MNLRRPREDEVEVNLTPLIDVVFLLLIFFMVSTTFVTQSEISLTLPEAAQDVVEERIERIDVAIDREGRYFVKGQGLVNTKLDTIKQAIADIAMDLTEPTIVIKADAGASHQSVVRVMDAARQLGHTKVTFATELKDDES